MRHLRYARELYMGGMIMGKWEQPIIEVIKWTDVIRADVDEYKDFILTMAER